jgi:hypothetical protein
MDFDPNIDVSAHVDTIGSAGDPDISRISRGTHSLGEKLASVLPVCPAVVTRSNPPDFILELLAFLPPTKSSNHAATATAQSNDSPWWKRRKKELPFSPVRRFKLPQLF